MFTEEAKSEVTPEFKETAKTQQNKGVSQSFEQAHFQHVLLRAAKESNHRSKLALEEIKEEKQLLCQVNQSFNNKKAGIIDEEVKEQNIFTMPKK